MNCTNDILAVSQFVDDAFTSGKSTIRNIQAGVYLATYNGTYDDLSNSFQWGTFDVTSSLAVPLTDQYQSFGAHVTTQVLCDYMESYDVDAFLSSQTTSMTIAEGLRTAFDNPGGRICGQRKVSLLLMATMALPLLLPPTFTLHITLSNTWIDLKPKSLGRTNPSPTMLTRNLGRGRPYLRWASIRART